MQSFCTTYSPTSWLRLCIHINSTVHCQTQKPDRQRTMHLYTELLQSRGVAITIVHRLAEVYANVIRGTRQVRLYSCLQSRAGNVSFWMSTTLVTASRPKSQNSLNWLCLLPVNCLYDVDISGSLPAVGDLLQMCCSPNKPVNLVMPLEPPHMCSRHCSERSYAWQTPAHVCV